MLITEKKKLMVGGSRKEEIMQEAVVIDFK